MPDYFAYSNMLNHIEDIKIMAKQEDDLDIIDRLNEAGSVRGSVLTAVAIFETSVDRLVQRVFRKDDHAVKYAVEPLLNTAGPLADLMVRLKLLYALGIISQDVYQDMERLIKLRDQLNRDSREFSFTSPETLETMKKLHAIEKMGMVQLEISPADEDADINFYNIYMARQEQVIRSAFSLAIASMCAELEKDNPLI
jgi:mannitol operon repressor